MRFQKEGGQKTKRNRLGKKVWEILDDRCRGTMGCEEERELKRRVQWIEEEGSVQFEQKHKGLKEVSVGAVDSREMVMDREFQVARVNKPLVSVKRIVEKGNLVHFGPKREDNYILNKDSGSKICLNPKWEGFLSDGG